MGKIVYSDWYIIDLLTMRNYRLTIRNYVMQTKDETDKLVPRRILLTIRSDHDSIEISIRTTKSYGDLGCRPTFEVLVLDLTGY
jgi:hypothetical protein